MGKSTTSLTHEGELEHPVLLCTQLSAPPPYYLGQPVWAQEWSREVPRDLDGDHPEPQGPRWEVLGWASLWTGSHCCSFSGGLRTFSGRVIFTAAQGIMLLCHVG